MSTATTLVLEFPSDAAFAMQMAEEPEMRDMLKLALASVFGFTPPFRFQLGRGAVRPESAPAARAAAGRHRRRTAGARADDGAASRVLRDGDGDDRAGRAGARGLEARSARRGPRRCGANPRANSSDCSCTTSAGRSSASTPAPSDDDAGDAEAG